MTKTTPSLHQDQPKTKVQSGIRTVQEILMIWFKIEKDRRIKVSTEIFAPILSQWEIKTEIKRNIIGQNTNKRECQSTSEIYRINKIFKKSKEMKNKKSWIHPTFNWNKTPKKRETFRAPNYGRTTRVYIKMYYKILWNNNCKKT